MTTTEEKLKVAREALEKIADTRIGAFFDPRKFAADALAAIAAESAPAAEPVANAGQALTREQVWAAFRSIPDIPDGLYAQVKHFLTQKSWCTHDLRAAGMPYPRTCAECGAVGPCKKYASPAMKNSAMVYESLPPEQKQKLTQELDELGQRIAEHKQSRDRRTHTDPVPFDRRHGDRRHHERED